MFGKICFCSMFFSTSPRHQSQHIFSSQGSVVMILVSPLTTCGLVPWCQLGDIIWLRPITRNAIQKYSSDSRFKACCQILQKLLNSWFSQSHGTFLWCTFYIITWVSRLQSYKLRHYILQVVGHFMLFLYFKELCPPHHHHHLLSKEHCHKSLNRPLCIHLGCSRPRKIPTTQPAEECMYYVIIVKKW